MVNMQITGQSWLGRPRLCSALSWNTSTFDLHLYLSNWSLLLSFLLNLALYYRLPL